MPKKVKPSGFMAFTMEWKEKKGLKMPIAEATKEAGKIWEKMSAEQRAPYNDMATEERKFTNRNYAARLTTTGVPISQVEKERLEQENKERYIKRDIEMTVRKSLDADRLELDCYYFIMVNYFSKTSKGGIYIPAEIAVCEFSLQRGVHRFHHTAINPGVNIYGQVYDAQLHSETTHQMPLPPNAMGVTNLEKVYKDILNFIRDENTKNYPPVYTHQESIGAVESVLKYLQGVDCTSDDMIKVYPIQYLFFIMKEATCSVGELEKPNLFKAESYFDCDTFQFHMGIGCDYHESIDRNQYCAKSYVIRWGYMFAKYMCNDLALPLIDGRHYPSKSGVSGIKQAVIKDTDDDAESFFSVNSEISDEGQNVAGSLVLQKERKKKPSYSVDFPSLSGFKDRENPATKLTEFDPTNSINSNPWGSKSAKLPRQPDKSHFDIDFANDEFPSTSTTTQGLKSKNQYDSDGDDHHATDQWTLVSRKQKHNDDSDDYKSVSSAGRTDSPKHLKQKSKHGKRN